MSDLDEQRLVRGARLGDETAFAQLIGRHYPLLLRSCERMLGNSDLSRDAAQEACLRAMLGIDHLRDDTRFGAWLVGIGLNVCRGLLASAPRQISYEAMRDSGRLAEPVAEGAQPAELIGTRELGRRGRAAIAGLPAGRRRAAALFYLDGLTQAD